MREPGWLGWYDLEINPAGDFSISEEVRDKHGAISVVNLFNLRYMEID